MRILSYNYVIFYLFYSIMLLEGLTTFYCLVLDRSQKVTTYDKALINRK